MAYIKELGGYIADVPNVHFKRCDGEIFYFDELTAASFTPNSDSIEVQGGQGQYALAYIPSGNSLEMQMTSAEFTMAMFEMANAVKSEEVSTYRRYKTVIGEVEDDKIVINDANATADAVAIRGLKLTTGAAQTGEFTADVASGNLTISLFAGDIPAGEFVEVTYQVTETATVVKVLTDSTTARGEVVMEWPVYSSGTDCTDAAVKGYVIISVPRARITALPGFDTSRKTAATNSITLSALDPKRPDKKMYEIAYIINA